MGQAIDETPVIKKPDATSWRRAGRPVNRCERHRWTVAARTPTSYYLVQNDAQPGVCYL